MTKKFPLWIGIIGSICSTLGVGIMSFLKPPETETKTNWFYFFLIILILIFLACIVYLIRRLLKKEKDLSGFLVNKTNREATSQNFAASALRTVDIFSGDLTWLEKDLHIYEDLILNKNVIVRILTHKVDAAVIDKAKKVGVKFKSYPNNMIAPITASIFDTSDEYESRALVIRKVSVKSHQGGTDYNYRFKEYYGVRDGIVIKSLHLLFDEYWNKG